MNASSTEVGADLVPCFAGEVVTAGVFEVIEIRRACEGPELPTSVSSEVILTRGERITLVVLELAIIAVDEKRPCAAICAAEPGSRNCRPLAGRPTPAGSVVGTQQGCKTPCRSDRIGRSVRTEMP